MAIRVMHVVLDMEIGGAEQVVRQLVMHSDRDQIENSIMCLSAQPGRLASDLPDKAGVAVFALGRAPGFDWAAIKRLREHIKAHAIQVLHCHQYTPYLYGVLAAAGLQTKVVFTEHGRFFPDVLKRKRAMANQLLIRITDRITAISEATRQALEDFEWISSRRVDLVYNGIEDLSQVRLGDAERAQLGIPDSVPIIGTIARLDSIKNQKILLDAYARLRSQLPDLVLLIIGDGPERSALEQQARALGVSDGVCFTGFLQRPQPYLELMDVFVLPSLSEGTSMTLLEAMSFSVPIVATRVGGNPEIVLHGETGLLTPSDDAEALAQALDQLLTSPASLEAMGAKGRERFLTNFTIDNMISRYAEIYRDVIA